MNVPNIIAALDAIVAIEPTVENLVRAVKSATTQGRDLTVDEVQAAQNADNAAKAKFDADLAAGQ